MSSLFISFARTGNMYSLRDTKESLLPQLYRLPSVIPSRRIYSELIVCFLLLDLRENKRENTLEKETNIKFKGGMQRETGVTGRTK